jgi:hypothetical protein
MPVKRGKKNGNGNGKKSAPPSINTRTALPGYVVNAGALVSAAGVTGDTGVRGTQWFEGHGAPGTVAGSIPGDFYLDLDTGDVYLL